VGQKKLVMGKGRQNTQTKDGSRKTYLRFEKKAGLGEEGRENEGRVVGSAVRLQLKKGKQIIVKNT